MNEYISVLILVPEIVAVLLYMHISFRQRISFDKYTIGVFFVSLVIYWMINEKALPQLCSVLVYVFIWYYCYFKFRQGVGKTISGFLFGFIIGAFVETLMLCATASLKNYFDMHVILGMLSIISLAISIIIYVMVVIRPRKIKYRKNKWVIVRTVLIGSALTVLIFDYYMNSANISIYTIMIIAFVIITFLYSYMLEQSEREVEAKKHELKLQEVYGGTYRELVKEVRVKQHDYKNQLGAMYSMQMVAKSLDDLKKMQKEYRETLTENNKYASILTCCNNSVLAGYIYYRCISCENDGIEVIYDIHADEAVCGFALHEIIEMLGILIDNACENVILEEEQKIIKLYVKETEEEMCFAVSNPAKYRTCTEINNMFNQGYSTKGEGRGMGLARIRELLLEHNEEIQVRNYTDNNINWIEFEIISSK